MADLGYSSLPKANLISRPASPGIWVHASCGHRAKIRGLPPPRSDGLSGLAWPVYVTKHFRAVWDEGHHSGPGRISRLLWAGMKVAFMQGRCIIWGLTGFQQIHPSCGHRKGRRCHSLPGSRFGGIVF